MSGTPQTDVAEEDNDVRLQRACADLIADFEASLTPFLYKQAADGTPKIRRWMRKKELERLVQLVRLCLLLK